MSKLVDKERLARLAKALDSRMKAAVKDEADRAAAAELRIEGKADANAAAIAAINNEQTGLLKQAKDYADGKDTAINAKVEQTAYDAKIKLLDEKDADLAQDIADALADIKTIQGQLGDGDFTGIHNAVNQAVQRLDAKDVELAAAAKAAQDDVDALEPKVAALEEKVGKDVDGENPATGLFLEVDEAMAKAVEAAQAVVTEKGRAEGQEAAIRQEMATEAARVNKKIADDIAAESALRVAEEQRIEGLVNKEVQAREAAVAGLKKTHDDEMDAVDAKIAALELAVNGGEGEGQDSIEDKIAAAQAAAEAKAAQLDTALENKLQANIDKKVAQADYNTKVQELAQEDARIAGLVDAEAQAARAAEEQLGEDIDAEEQARIAADSALETRIKANEDKLAVVQGNEAQEGSIAKAEKDAKDYADQKIAELVDSAPDAMNTLNELAEAIKAHGNEYSAYITTVNGQIATAKQEAINAAGLAANNKDAALHTTISAEIDADVKAEADRAKGEEQKIRGEFVAADTALEEKVNQKIADDVAAAIAQEVKDRNAAIKVADDRAKEEEADIRADFAAADTQVLIDAKAYADQEVGKEKSRAEKAEQGLQAAIDKLNGADDAEGSVAKAVKDAVNVENQRAVARENAIESAYKAADQGLAGRIADLEEMMGVGGEEADKSALEKIREDIAALKQEDKDLAAEDQRLAGEIAKKVAQADYNAKVKELGNADVALGNRIAVFEVGGDQDVAAKEVRLAAAEGEIDALQQFMNGHSHAKLEADILANKNAIDKEVKTDRDAAIAAAIAPYAKSDDVKLMLGNVVNSLAISVSEDNKLVLKLGGVDGIALHETKLDMATDADIDAIIAGLDAE